MSEDRIKELEAQVATLKHELKYANANNRLRNLEMDALHYVWCDGGCPGGVHRWQEDEVTEEIVNLAVRNTSRLVRWWKCKKRRDEL